jgi:hypothetical protein
MGNCFKNKPVLPIYHEKEKETELQSVDKNDYGLSIDIWAGHCKGLYDVRFNFYSKSDEYDLILYKSIHYICMKNFNISVSPINYRKQAMIVLNDFQLQCLKTEIDKLVYANVKWRNLAQKKY